MIALETLTAPMQCHSCSHALAEKARFCDDCGDSAAVVDFDAEALKIYCRKCAGMLRGAKKYCIHCGEPSAHSGKAGPNPETHWLLVHLMRPRVQAVVLGSVIFVLSLPLFTPVRYAFMPAGSEAARQAAANRSREKFQIQPLIDPGKFGDEVLLPAGVAQDSMGNLYVSDAASHLVYKIDPEGNQTVFAGTGAPGYSGDGKRATEAALNSPRGLAVDDMDGVLIADSGNDVIRRVSAGGYAATVAGEPPSDRLREMRVARMPDAGKAQLMAPSAIVIDEDGRLYVTEDHCESGPRPATLWLLTPKT